MLYFVFYHATILYLVFYYGTNTHIFCIVYCFLYFASFLVSAGDPTMSNLKQEGRKMIQYNRNM